MCDNQCLLREGRELEKEGRKERRENERNKRAGESRSECSLTAGRRRGRGSHRSLHEGHPIGPHGMGPGVHSPGNGVHHHVGSPGVHEMSGVRGVEHPGSPRLRGGVVEMGVRYQQASRVATAHLHLGRDEV